MRRVDPIHCLLAWAIALSGGCGASARATLFDIIDAPAFSLDAIESEYGAVLVAYGYTTSDLEDHLCAGTDSSDCIDDYFVTFAFYRSDNGDYGAYEPIGDDPIPGWLDVTWTGNADSAWRAAIVRQKLGGEEYLSRVSVAATVEPADTGS